MRVCVKPALMQRGGDGARPGRQQAHVGEQERPQARAVVKGVANKDGDIPVVFIGSESMFELPILAGTSIAIILWTAFELHSGSLSQQTSILRRICTYVTMGKE